MTLGELLALARLRANESTNAHDRRLARGILDLLASDTARRAVELAEHERDAYRSMLCDVVACGIQAPLPEELWRRGRELLKDGPEPLESDVSGEVVRDGA